MATSAQISITGSPTLAFSGVGNVVFKNHPGGAVCYLGDSGVSSSTGLKVEVNEQVSMNVNSPDDVYVVGSSGVLSVLSVR